MSNISKIILSFFIACISFGGYVLVTQAAANPGANALFEQSLAQPLGTTDANMYVTSGADVQGNLLPLGSSQCLSVDTGQPNFEAICGLVTTSSSSGLTLFITTRGLSTATATTSNPLFIFTHRRGADVRITDFPVLPILNNELSGTQTIPGPIFYYSNFTPAFWGTAPSSTIVTLGQAASIAAAGCGNASESVNGCSQLSTSAQAALGTSVGSTNARLVLPASLATSTPYNGGSSVIPVTGTNEKLSQSFLDLTQNFTTTGAWTHNTATTTLNATTTIAASTSTAPLILNGVAYGFPSTQGASSSALLNDGNGNISWQIPQTTRYTYATTTSWGLGNISGGYATSSPFLTIPAGVLTASSTIIFEGSVSSCTAGSGGSGSCGFALRDTTGQTMCSTAISTALSTTNTGASYVHCTVLGKNSASVQYGTQGGVTTNYTGSNTVTNATFGLIGSTVNLANGVSFVAVANGNANETNMTIAGFSVIVER